MMPAQENNCAKQDSIELFDVIVSQAGKLESWKAGKLESWKAGKLESWKAGKYYACHLLFESIFKRD